MIPAVEDFTQRLQQQQQQQLQHPTSRLSSDPDLSDTQELQIELLGKALISPEQLRAQLMVQILMLKGAGFVTRVSYGTLCVAGGPRQEGCGSHDH